MKYLKYAYIVIAACLYFSQWKPALETATYQNLADRGEQIVMHTSADLSTKVLAVLNLSSK
jgi:hypothetical protein